MPWYLPLYRRLFRSSTFLSYFLKKPRNILKKQGVKGYMRSRFCGMIFESGRKRTGLPIQPSAFLFYCLPNNIFTPPMSFRGFYQSTKIGSSFLFYWSYSTQTKTPVGCLRMLHGPKGAFAGGDFYFLYLLVFGYKL